MKEQILGVVSAIIAGIIIMILHELPKTIVYYAMDEEAKKVPFRNVLKLHHYIDPIGLIFCVTSFAGFSKPYMYKIKERNVNRAMGITGFLSLGILFFVNLLLLKGVFCARVSDAGMLQGKVSGDVSLFFMNLCFHFAFLSLGMLIVNLFPIVFFDMGNLLAGTKPIMLDAFIRKDFLLKLCLLALLILGVLTQAVKTILVVLIL